MSNNPAEDWETNEMSVAPGSIAKFQAVLAEYSCRSELTTLRRSPRKPISRNVDDIPQLDNEEVEENFLTRDAAKTSSRSNKRKNGDFKSTPKKKKPKRGYAEPEQYAHLNGLPDILAPRLDVLFCGINPGQYSATVGHHFANPTNHFWRCLRDSGFTGDKLVPACDDHTLPSSFSLGLTNIVHRPTAEQNELSVTELNNGVPDFIAKVAEHQPYVVCFVGLGIAKVVKSYCLPRGAPEFKRPVTAGFQPFKLVHGNGSAIRETLFYAMPSTSGRVVQFQREDKVRIMRELKVKLTDIKAGRIETAQMHPIGVSLM